jgi:type I restriction enzyme S subunit
MTLNKVRLVDCCLIKPPKYEAKNLISSNDLVSFVPMKNLGIDTPDLLLDADKKLSDVIGSYTYFKDNDVLLAKITPCFENGKLGVAKGLTNGIGFGSSEFIVFRSKGNIVADYLYYYLLQQRFRDVGKSVMTGAVGHKRVPKYYIENSEIHLPSLEIQKQIVAKLDQAFADIEKTKVNAEQNLKNARELFESYRSQTFSQCDDWKITTLGDLAEISSGGTPRKSTKEFWDGDIAWYSSGELNDLYTKESKEKITNEGLNGSNAKLFSKGSLLIGMYDTAALKMSILDRDGTFNQAVVGVKPNDDINLEFILHSINSIKSELLQQRSGVRQQNLNQAKIKNIPIKHPSIKKQNEVVVFLKSVSNECDNLSEIYKKKLESLHELKQSILQKAFNGELT